MFFGFTQKAAHSCAAFLFLAGCAATSLPQGRAAVVAWSAERSFAPVTGTPLLALLRQKSAATVLTVYLEGDGAAWPSLYRPPADPTPTNSMVLDMANADPATAVAYLARPCQYAEAMENCPQAYWTDRRFSPTVVEQMDQALDLLKQASGTGRLRLVGYSGGGVIATLLAARRRDVEHLVTVAAPLRVAAWTAHHGVTPLTGLDPDLIATAMPPAVHLSGAQDKVVPSEIVAPFAVRTGGRTIVVPGYDHDCCWSADWSRFLKEMQ